MEVLSLVEYERLDLDELDSAVAERLRDEHGSRIEILLDNIVPALDGLDPTQTLDQLMHAAVEANVRWTLRQLHDSPEGRAALARNEIQLVGAIYELDSGRVRFLDDPAG